MSWQTGKDAAEGNKGLSRREALRESGLIAGATILAGTVLGKAALPDQSQASEETSTSLNRLAEFKGKHAVFIGDSFESDSDDYTYKWPNKLCEELGLVKHNYATSSTGFSCAGRNGVNAPYNSQVQTAAKELRSIASQIAYVFIAGGYNDVSYGTENINVLKKAVIECVKNAHESFPNAIIVMIPMLWGRYRFTQKAFSYYGGIIQGSLASGAPCQIIPHAYTWIIGQDCFRVDLTHPVESGHTRITNCIITELLGGSASRNESFPITALNGFSFEESGCGSNANNAVLRLTEGHIESSSIYVKSAKNIANGSVLGKVKSPVVVPGVPVGVPAFHGGKIVGSVVLRRDGKLVFHGNNKKTKSPLYFGPFNYPLFCKEPK